MDDKTKVSAPEQADTTEPAGAPPLDETTRAVEPTAANTSQWKEHAEVAKQQNKEKFGKLKDFGRAYWAKKKWTVPLTLFLLVVLILAVPQSRYPVLGLVLKKDVVVTVADKTTGQPVTAATVSADGVSTKTDNHGKAVLHLGVGKHAVAITKKYYKPYNGSVFAGVLKSAPLAVNATATGRQVPISVTDYITGKPIENAVVRAAGSEVKTDKKGGAVLVLPTTSTTQKATISLEGYNTSAVNVLVTARVVTTNKFTMTPAGKLFFLSNLSGKIDVVKADLDGKNRKVVLAGTGSEDTNSTSLLASRDWKYLALLSKRDGKQGLYLINASTDEVTNIDGGSDTASFTLVGWSGDTFVYQVYRSNVQSWQSAANIIKSYDANAGKLFNIDQSQGEGTGLYDYANTNFGQVAITSNGLVYAKNWSASSADKLTGKSATLMSVNADGTGKKSVKEFPVPAGTQYYYAINTVQYEPNAVYLQVYPDNTKASYFVYEDGAVTQKSDMTDDAFAKAYPTYLISPGSKQSFWTELRDNKNTLFIGNSDGAAGKQIATLSSYIPYGWYSDKYLLVSKNGSELYAMPVDGSKQPVKITDYYKPQLTYRGYGGGYGGI